MSADKEYQLQAPTDAVSSAAFHPTNRDLLLTASWDSTARLFDVSSPSSTSPSTTYAHPAPVLDITFGAGSVDGKAYSACLDRGVRELDLATGSSGSPSSQRVLGVHNEAARCVHFSLEHHLVMSGSWDRSLVSFDPRSPPTDSPALTISDLPGKVFAMDASAEKLVVAMSARKLHLYDLRSLTAALPSSGGGGTPPAPWQERESSLKFMTRAVKCMPNGTGYASTSIEGRVAVEFFDPSPESQAKKYAFKCHRQVVDGVDTVYPVNCLAFHPIHGTFATGGGDGIVSIWDPTAKKRLRQFQRYPASVSSLAFSCDGEKLVVACSVMEEEGSAGAKSEARHAVVVRSVGDDCKPKAK